MRMIYYHSYLWTFYNFNMLSSSVRKLTLSVFWGPLDRKRDRSDASVNSLIWNPQQSFRHQLSFSNAGLSHVKSITKQKRTAWDIPCLHDFLHVTSWHTHNCVLWPRHSQPSETTPTAALHSDGCRPTANTQGAALSAFIGVLGNSNISSEHLNNFSKYMYAHWAILVLRHKGLRFNSRHINDATKHYFLEFVFMSTLQRLH